MKVNFFNLEATTVVDSLVFGRYFHHQFDLLEVNFNERGASPVHASADFSAQVADRLRSLDALAQAGGLDEAIAILARTIADGGVAQAFGTGHSEAFAMEIAGRAGGFIPSHALRLNDLVLTGAYDRSWLGTPEFERRPDVVDTLWSMYDIRPADCFLIASNSGANGSIVGLALRAKEEGHPVIAVTSLEHSRGVESKHPSGKRLFEVANVTIDNLAPYGDATIQIGDGPKVGPVSSITAAYIAQLLTLGAVEKLTAAGTEPPIFLSANIPGGDAHNQRIEARYGQRINPFVAPAEEAATA
ncbi:MULTISPECIES: sugar isomerase domain-containing protein [Microbacterium]|uniref:Sugar isomerase domain-containing protein n=1 Tax=Microbacterium wangchenii TaxID=2541726 RepID=A0ABX5SSR2_9MICO|nr:MULTISPECIES: SIS domain-containing protein [Microbacterium]MCK6066555.1 SIS domain-containing protein [Microbacterium sp. EYE_512]QBR87894.1 sugar isomerase domain-containing protein [Microbacterium wangchenii]TXK08999.1 SIS domain-containing protein [Microbacterium wangchenii]